MANLHTATFETSAVSPAGDDDYTVKGVLQIKGETQALEFPVTVQQDDAGRLVFETEFEIDRGDFDVGSGSWSDPSIVSNEVKVKAHIVSKIGRASCRERGVVGVGAWCMGRSTRAV